MNKGLAKGIAKYSFLILVLSALGFFLFNFISSVNAPTAPEVSGAVIWTDKSDYLPGDTVLISGSGFVASSPLTVSVMRPGSSAESCIDSSNCNSRFRNGPLTSGSSGSFSGYQYLLDGILGTYTINVSDGTTTAQTAFTDAVNSTPPTPLPNPVIPACCGIDIALVIDYSSSINSTELAQMKTALISFVDALSGTSTMFSVTKFGTTATVIQPFTNNFTSVKTAINSVSVGINQGTNWQLAISTATGTFDPRTYKPNMMIFASDGNPTYPSCGGSTTCQTDVDAAINESNIAKSSPLNIRILTIGIGDQLNVGNLENISGTNVNTGVTSDVITTNFSDMAQNLATLANQFCGGTINVKKLVNGTAASGWNFTASVTGGLSSPAYSITSPDGFINPIFNITNITGPTANASITETSQVGYDFSSAQCEYQNHTSAGIPGTGTVTGIVIGQNDTIYCEFNNTHFACVNNSTCGSEYYTCVGNTIVKHDPYCDLGDHTCKDSSINTIDCNSFNQNSCSDIYNWNHTTGTCVSGQSTCSVASSTGDCNDGLHCNGQETCSAGNCVAGASVNCSQYNIAGIGRCDNSPDDIAFTWDFRNAFTSTCDEINDNCTTGSDTIIHTCNYTTCGAECDATHTCADKCVGSSRYYSGLCQSGCTCSYSSQDCSSLSGWVNTTTTRWNSIGQCTEKEQLQQEYRTYTCSPSPSVACTYTVTSYQWIYTGNTRNKDNGTSCDDGNLCTINDVCSLGQCTAGTPKNCDDSNSCTIDSCNPSNGNCIHTLNDTTGPTTSNLIVIPSFNNGMFNATAIATGTCSPINRSEYFLGYPATVGSCGLPGSGTPMDASDGSFDQLIENVNKTGIFWHQDGVNWICVQSQNTAGTWGNCVCTYFETDITPPECPYNFYLNGQLNPSEYLICGSNNVKLNATVCDGQSPIQGGEYFLDTQIPPVPQPWFGVWMNTLYNFTSTQYGHCSVIGADVVVSNISDGTHSIKLRGKDSVENWGKIQNCNSISFITDTTPPVTTKTLNPADGKSVACNDTTANGKTITDGCNYVKQGTTITLNASDPDPQGTGEYAGNVVIHYNVYWSLDGTSWTQDQSGQSNVNQPVTITLSKDSYHLIEYWSTDGCNLAENHHYELDIVDTQAPVTTKSLIGPNIVGDGFTWITQNTQINLTCTDPQPHPVDHTTIYYRYNVDDGAYKDWTTYTAPFHFTEDSNHSLQYYCVDALGNTEQTNIEIDKVDSTPPTTVKTYGTPFYSPNNNVTEWINSSTPITLTATDGGAICAVGVDSTYWRITLLPNNDACQNPSLCNGQSGTGSFTRYTDPFTISNESCHLIEYYSIDKFDNGETIKKQCVYVDNTGPTATKTLGDPSYPAKCTDNCYVNQSTMISISCSDPTPHPVGEDTAYYRIYNESGLLQDWRNYTTTGPFHYKEDSNHTLQFYCVDKLGNVGPVNNETDLVDSQAPVTTKSLDGPNIADNGFTWITQNTNIVLSCTDPEPHPVDHTTIYYRYEVDDGTYNDWTNYTAPFHFTEDSNHTLQFYCVDALGNAEQVKTEVDKVDNTPPVITPDPCYNVQSGTEVTIWAIITDNKVGVNGSTTYAYVKYPDQSTVPVFLTYNSVTGHYEGTWNAGGLEGVYYIDFAASDLLGNSAYLTSAYLTDGKFIIVDNTPPNVSSVFTGRNWIGLGDKFYVDAEVDDNSLHFDKICGLPYCYVRIVDNEHKEAYLQGTLEYVNGVYKCAGFVTVNDTFYEAQAQLWVNAFDAAGNNASVKKLEPIGIDNAKMISISRIDEGWYKGGQWINGVVATVDSSKFGNVISCSASIPGVSVENTLTASGNQCIGNIRVPVDISDGEKVLTISAINVNGKTVSDTVNIRIDNTPPVKTIIEPHAVWYSSFLPINVSITDGGQAGVDDSKVYFNITHKSFWGIEVNDINGVLGTTDGLYYTSNVNVSDLTQGTEYKLSITACDKVGNCIDPTVTFKVDHTAPTMPGSLAVADSPIDADGNVYLSWTASTDSLSGVNYYKVYVNGVLDGTTTSTNYEFKNLADGTYTFFVTAVDVAGNEGAATEGATVVQIGYVPPAPSGGSTGGSSSGSISVGGGGASTIKSLSIMADSSMTTNAGSNNSLTLKVTNNGNVKLNDVRISFAGVGDWITINPISASINAGSSVDYVATIAVPISEKSEVKTITFAATSSDGTTASKVVTLNVIAAEGQSLPVCGNGICEFNEDGSNCCIDCGCSSGYVCTDNVCEQSPKLQGMTGFFVLVSSPAGILIIVGLVSLIIWMTVFKKGPITTFKKKLIFKKGLVSARKSGGKKSHTYKHKR